MNTKIFQIEQPTIYSGEGDLPDPIDNTTPTNKN